MSDQSPKKAGDFPVGEPDDQGMTSPCEDKTRIGIKGTWLGWDLASLLASTYYLLVSIKLYFCSLLRIKQGLAFREPG